MTRHEGSTCRCLEPTRSTAPRQQFFAEFFGAQTPTPPNLPVYPAVGARPSVSPHYLHFLGSVTGLGSIQRAVLKKLTSAANSPLVSKLVLAEQDQAHDRNKAIRFVKPLRP